MSQLLINLRDNKLDAILENYTTTANEVSILPTLISFLACIIMSFILRSVYINRSFSLNRNPNR